MLRASLTIKDASDILDTLSDFHLGAEKVYRYIGDPYVDGDNIAEHTARTIRLAIYSMPFLLEEFAEHPDIKHLPEDIYATILTHDDDEVAQGFDIISMNKNHNSRDQEEIDAVNEKMKNLPAPSREYVIKLFSSFRRKDTLAAKIAKVFDNVTGNQLVLEQKLGIVAPNAAKFAIWYAEKVRGVSKTTDLLLDALVKQIVDYREFAKNNNAELEILIDKALAQEGCNLPRNELKNLIRKLLEIDILSYELQKEKININLWEYK